MKTQHTPGPWNIQKVESAHAMDRFVYIRITSPNHDHPAGIGAVSIPSVNRTKKQKALVELYKSQGEALCEANAKLIAAAPELLAALEGLQDMLNNHYGDDPDETPLIKAAFQAIKKATE